MKILIVKLSSIGDIVHTLPALAAIKRAVPDAEVSWAVESKSAEILRGNRLLFELIEIDTKALRSKNNLGASLLAARRQIKTLRASKFDVTLDFQGLLKSAAIAKLTRAPRRCGFARDALREPASRFLMTETFRVDLKTHVAVKNLTLAAKALKIAVPGEEFEFPVYTSGEHISEAEKIISQTGANFAILNPAGGWTTKLWHAEKFGALADRLWQEEQIVSIVTTAPGESQLAERVSKSSVSGKILRATPTLKGFYELARRARVYVGGDTGPTHLAVAAGAPVVGLFGPTEWWFNGSPNRLDICVDRTDIACRADCNRRICSNWICLDIEVETVLEAIRQRMDAEKSTTRAKSVLAKML